MPSTNEKIAFSRGEDHGNYENAYVTETWDEGRVLDWARRTFPGIGEQESAILGALIGFFSSYESHEVPQEHQEIVEDARRCEHLWRMGDEQ